jgi:hypothetical protein
MTKKSPAQLQREIDESLSAHAAKPRAAKAKGKHRVWYHVTERDNVDHILKKGFSPGVGSADRGTYLWDDLRLAEDWIGGHSYRDPVILAIETDAKPTSVYDLYVAEGNEDADQFYGHYVVPHDGIWKPQRVRVHS